MNQFETIVQELDLRCKSIKINRNQPQEDNNADSVDAVKIQMEMIGKELPALGEKITETLEEILEERGVKFKDENERTEYVEKVKPTITQIATRIIRGSL
ncbi:hypothetical protein [Ekhidna sp.]|uniref:hypothetical protein n=1 Tax=Ekhidna sp. TaxID=2608089 RepID=UPI003CCC12DC